MQGVNQSLEAKYAANRTPTTTDVRSAMSSADEAVPNEAKQKLLSKNEGSSEMKTVADDEDYNAHSG